MGLRGLAGGLLWGVSLLLVAPASTFAAAQVQLRPAAGVAGSSMLLRASGLAASSRVVVRLTSARAKRAKASPRGRLVVRLTVPRREGWLTVVTRSGRHRVVNRFLVIGRAADVLELAGTGARRVRLSPTRLLPGGVLHVHGGGYGRGKRLRLSGFGAPRRIRAGR